MYIAVDFDGTCVEHKYPKVGNTLPYCVDTLKALVAKGHKICLNTMRDAEELQQAVAWFHDNDIPLYGINENKSQKKWTTSPKVYGNVYIDDCACGCPLVKPHNERPYVDWFQVRQMLESDGWFV